MYNSSSERGYGPAGGSRVWRVPGTRRIRVAPAEAMSRNLRTALIFRGFISLIGAAFYPIYFRPLMAAGGVQERTSHKSSWYCSRRRAATRVESVVGSIWPEMRRLTPPLIMKVDKRLHAFSSAASSISHLARERWLEQKTLEGHKKSYA